MLVDEYDKPILDALDAPAVARGNRDFLHGLYSTIKSGDAHVEFTLLTGVSKFSKVSLFSRPQQPQGHHSGSALFGRLRLHRLGSGHGLRLGAAWPRPGRNPRLVQRLQLARRGTSLQPLRHPAAVRPPAVRRLVVRDRHAVVPRRDAGQAQDRLRDARQPVESGRPAVRLRRGRHRHRGAAVPDRLPHHPRRRAPRWKDGLPSRLPEPRGAAEPEREPAAPPHGTAARPGGARRPAVTTCCWSTTSPAWRRCSGRSSPASPTSGTRRTTSPATRATTPVSSTAASPRSDSTLL